MVEASFAPEFVRVDAGGRIALPAQYCKRVPWLAGTQALRVWLLLLEPHRFRLLSDLEVEQDPNLREIRGLIVDGPGETQVPPTEFETSGRAAVIGRLIPTTLAPPPPSWRLTLPKKTVIDPDGSQTVVLLFSLGYLEIWLPGIYRAALTAALDNVI